MQPYCLHWDAVFGSEKKLNGRGKIRNSFFHCSASHPTHPIPTWAHDESVKVSERRTSLWHIPLLWKKGNSFFIFLIREIWETQWCDIAIAEMGRNNNKKVPHGPKFISRINLPIWPPLSHIAVAPKNGHLKIKLASLWATQICFAERMLLNFERSHTLLWVPSSVLQRPLPLLPQPKAPSKSPLFLRFSDLAPPKPEILFFFRATRFCYAQRNLPSSREIGWWMRRAWFPKLFFAEGKNNISRSLFLLSSQFRGTI